MSSVPVCLHPQILPLQCMEEEVYSTDISQLDRGLERSANVNQFGGKDGSDFDSEAHLTDMGKDVAAFDMGVPADDGVVSSIDMGETVATHRDIEVLTDISSDEGSDVGAPDGNIEAESAKPSGVRDNSEPGEDMEAAESGGRAEEQAYEANDSDEEPEDDYPEARQGFAALYDTLQQQEGIIPDQESGAIYPPEHQGVKIMPNGDVYGPHQELREFLRSEQLTSHRGSDVMGFEAHHLLESRMMEPFGFSEVEGLCVATYADEHMNLVHGKDGVDLQLPRGYRYDIEDVVEGHMQAYNDIGRPEWAEAVRNYVQANQERIIQAYGDGTVPWATDEDVERAREYLRSL